MLATCGETSGTRRDFCEQRRLARREEGGGGDAVNLQNGEFGADQKVLSDGNTSATGASFPNLQSVFDQRWAPSGDERYLVHPLSDNQIAPNQDVDWSGNIALTSSSGRMSASDTDLYADLGLFDSW